MTGSCQTTVGAQCRFIFGRGSLGKGNEEPKSYHSEAETDVALILVTVSN